MLKIKDDYKWLFTIFFYVCFWICLITMSVKLVNYIKNEGLKSFILPIWEGKK